MGLTIQMMCLLVVMVLTYSTFLIKAEYLFRATPGGDGAPLTGIWGGELPLSANGQGQDLFESGLGQLNTSNSNVVRGLDIISASFDPISQDVLLEIEPSLVLARCILCKNHQYNNHTLLFHQPELFDSQNPYLVNSKCSWKCGWNAFALYNSKIYFVLSAVLGDHPASLTREIQIRVLEGCDHLTNDRTTKFPVLECSRHITTIFRENFEWPNGRPAVWPASSMTITQTGEDLQFYVQLFNDTSNGLWLDLMQIIVSNTETVTTATRLYSVSVPQVYGSSLRVRGLGQVHFLERTVCWTAAEKLLCGQVTGHTLYDVSVILDIGDAANAGICTGMVEGLPVGRILTGVAVAHLSDPLAVYFGCYSQLAGIGGVGLVKLLWSGTSLKKTLYPVQSGGNKVLGGTLLLMDNLNDKCPVEMTTVNLSESSDATNDYQTGGGCRYCLTLRTSNFMLICILMVMSMV